MGGPTGPEILGLVAELSSDPRTGHRANPLEALFPGSRSGGWLPPIIHYGSLRAMKTRQ